MNNQFHVSVIPFVSSEPVDTGLGVAHADPVTIVVPFVRPPSQPFQLEWSPHLAALVGIVALALLGSVLIARNRLDNRTTVRGDANTQTEEFLTDREKVKQLIQENGGRMKQSRIVDSVDWSKAKVSRLLAELEDDDQITKLRLGRENLVCLPGHEPTASKSPEQPNNES